MNVNTAPKNKRVLVLTDDEHAANTLRTQLLGHHAFDVEIETSTEAAIKLLNTQTVDLIITDEIVATMSGFEIIYEMGLLCPRLPEIMLMSSDPKVSLSECHDLGVSRVLPKPLRVDEISFLLERTLLQERRFDAVTIDEKILGRLYGNVKEQKKPYTVYKLEVSNIGRGGFFYKLMDNGPKPELGQIVHFELVLGMVPNCVFKGKGIVRWAHFEAGNRGFGIEFVTLDAESEKLLSAFVDLFKVRSYVPIVS